MECGQRRRFDLRDPSVNVFQIAELSKRITSKARPGAGVRRGQRANKSLDWTWYIERKRNRRKWNFSSSRDVSHRFDIVRALASQSFEENHAERIKI
jgi:hypothetical protein